MQPTPDTTTMPRKAIPYSRFSGKRQEAGDSQRRQDELAEKAALEERVTLDRSLSLRDKGVSAFRGANWHRGDLGRFIDLVDAGVIPAGTILIIEQVNRLSRLPWMDQVQLWKEILQRGIVIRTCVPPSRYTHENMNELAVGCPVVLFMMLANLESKQKSDWVREAWGQKKKGAREQSTPHGKHGPTWLNPVTAPHPRDATRAVTLRYEVNEERKAAILRIYELAIEGYGAHRIIRQLNADGIRPWMKQRRATAPVWNTGTINYILHARETFGEYQQMKRLEDGRYVPDGQPIPDYYPAILTEATYNAVQAARRTRLRRTRRNGKRPCEFMPARGGRPGKDGMETSLFTHLAFEAETRQPLHVQSCSQRGIPYKYLNTDPPRLRVQYPVFEAATLDAIADLRPSDIDGKHQSDALNTRVDQLQAERSRMGLELDALDQQIREIPPARWPKRVVARMAELEAQIAAKDEELRIAKEQANTSTRIEALTEVQTCLGLLVDARLKGDIAHEAAVRSRIKARLPLFIEAIWLRVQPITKMGRYVHVRIYFQGGHQAYLCIPIGKTHNVAPWRLKDADFRAGDIGRHAVVPTLPQLATAVLTS